MKILSFTLLTVILCSISACSKDHGGTDDMQEGSSPSQSNGAHNTSYKEIDWTDLLPDEDLYALENPPEYLSEIEDGSAEDSLPSQLKASESPAEDPYQQALISKNIRPEFDGRHIRIPGFIVPLEFDDQQTITTFFLVPFFGACLHMPPPPPNQILYAEYEPGIRLEALYDPFWIEGTVSTTLIENELATAAYSISVGTIEPYTEEGTDDVTRQDIEKSIEAFENSDLGDIDTTFFEE